MKIGLIGYGVLGKQLEAFLKEVFGNEFELTAVFDDYVEGSKTQFAFNDWREDRFKEIQLLPCLGYQHLALKAALIQEIKAANRTLFTFVHPRAYVFPNCKIGEGSIIFPQACVDQNVILGDGCLLHINCSIAHDCELGTANFIGPGVNFSGGVKTGAECFFGTASSLANNIQIGREVKVGIGSVVVNNLPDHANAIGNPASIKNTPLNLI